MLDSMRIRQILINLLSNAIKFSYDNEIIKTFVELEETDSQYV
jgi:signal transduction histidine kinase